MPVNYLIVVALHRFHTFYDREFAIECPRGSGKMMNLADIAH